MMGVNLLYGDHVVWLGIDKHQRGGMGHSVPVYLEK
jgi:hypothetical protein